MTDRSTSSHVAVRPSVTVMAPEGTYVFEEAFRIGRDAACDVRIDQGRASRIHAEVFFEEGQWWVRDLGSTNGTYLDGRRIERAPLPDGSEIRLGEEGPSLAVSLASPAEPDRTVMLVAETPRPSPGDTVPSPPSAAAPPDPSDGSLSFYIRRYVDQKGDAGEHTMMIRQAIRHVETKRRKKYVGVIAAVSVLGFMALGYGVYKAVEYRRQALVIRAQREQIAALEGQAREIFYQMKALELAVGNTPDVRNLDRRYDRFVEELGLYENRSEADRLIYRVARRFGECEVDMPESFIRKIHEYIGYWQSTPRYREAVRRAGENGYVEPIVRTFLAHGLSPQFFYLAMQESSFNPNSVGPLTRFGHAKGMWQFIPLTAARYGLHTGPLVDIGRADPLDERHDFEKSTRAAARYIRDVYETDAQASGLLVMASYNWGEHNVVRLIRQLPGNPRERNFWTLLDRFGDRLPEETYHYVFYIIAAAVIGENPRLFGFDFDNPLEPAVRAAEGLPPA